MLSNASKKRHFRSLVYLPTSNPGIGGAEATVAIVASALEKYGDVDVLSIKSDFSAADILACFGIKLNHTNFLFAENQVPFKKFPGSGILNFIRMMFFDHRIGEGYDLMVCITHTMPPLCYAGAGILHVLFPSTSKRLSDVLATRRGSFGMMLKRFILSCYYRFAIKKHLATYDLLTANSEFTAEWCGRYWRTADWKSWYPPVSLQKPPEEIARAGSIISVGRFDGHGCKMQREMVQWFRRLDVAGSELVLAGTCAGTPLAQSYLRDTIAAGEGADCRFLVNCGFGALSDAYRISRIYWHAMGYGAAVDNPFKMEHFGMTTVEAMSAGCVPVVFAGGGQLSVVDHGVNGFHWKTPDELLRYTRILLADETLWQKMSRAAVEKAQQYSVDNFVNRLHAAVASCRPHAASLAPGCPK